MHYVWFHSQGILEFLITAYKFFFQSKYCVKVTATFSIESTCQNRCNNLYTLPTSNVGIKKWRKRERERDGAIKKKRKGGRESENANFLLRIYIISCLTLDWISTRIETWVVRIETHTMKDYTRLYRFGMLIDKMSRTMREAERMEKESAQRESDSERKKKKKERKERVGRLRKDAGISVLAWPSAMRRR